MGEARNLSTKLSTTYALGSGPLSVRYTERLAMNPRRSLLWLVVLLMALPLAQADEAAPGAGAAAARRRSALGVRQARVLRLMQDLDPKFRCVAAALDEAGEKEGPEKLLAALHSSKQMLIETRLDEIA